MSACVIRQLFIRRICCGASSPSVHPARELRDRSTYRHRNGVIPLWPDRTLFTLEVVSGRESKAGKVDPVSLGIAVAALLASKFGEQLAQDAGASSWRAVTRLRAAVAAKFGHVAGTDSGAVMRDDDAVPEVREVSAEAITAAARSDPAFAAELQRLVTVARQDRSIEAFVANAYDTAKQVNIRGDNTGTINL